MWTTDRTKKTVITPRPVRVAYIVPSSPTHDLLNVLFDESMSRWGGRRTPIVPSDGTDIHEEYWNLLNLWDADIIYSYAEISNDLHARLAHRLAPSEISRHPQDAGVRDLRPRLRTSVSLLTSMSVLPVLSRWHVLRGQRLPEVLDKERHVDVPRDLANSFGFVSSCLNDFTLAPHARRRSFRPPDTRRYAQRFRSPEEITYIESLTDLETQLGDMYGLLCVAQLSDMLTRGLSALLSHGSAWEDHLSIIVGDDVSDRLLFWNGIHRYEVVDVCGKLSAAALFDGPFCERNTSLDWSILFWRAQPSAASGECRAPSRNTIMLC